MQFCEQNFIRARDIFTRFARDFSSWISLGKIQSLLKGCLNITGVDDKAWLQKLVSANQFIYSNLWKKFVANKSWFTALKSSNWIPCHIEYTILLWTFLPYLHRFWRDSKVWTVGLVSRSPLLILTNWRRTLSRSMVTMWRSSMSSVLPSIQRSLMTSWSSMTSTALSIHSTQKSSLLDLKLLRRWRCVLCLDFFP